MRRRPLVLAAALGAVAAAGGAAAMAVRSGVGQSTNVAAAADCSFLSGPAGRSASPLEPPGFVRHHREDDSDARSSPWHVEYDNRSCAVLDGGRGDDLVLRFALAPGRARNQFAAAVLPVTGRLALTGKLTVQALASQPMRLAIQLRQRDELGASRWRRSMYVDSQARTTVFDLSSFEAVSQPATARMPAESIAALMIGVDTVNTNPGTRGAIALSTVRLEPR